MRSSVIFFFYLSFCLPIFAKAQVIGKQVAQIHPVKLSKAHFFSEDFVTLVHDSKFDPFAYANKRPVSLHFVKPGHLSIDWGTEVVDCRTRSSGLTVRITLEVQCETGTKFANWNWIAENRAETNLLFAFTGPPRDPKETLDRLDFSFDELVAKYDAEYKQRMLPYLTGIYLDKTENVLYITPQGETYYNDELKPSQLKGCLYLKANQDAEDATRGACLTIDFGPTPLTLVFKPDTTVRRLQQVSARQDLLPPSRGFELVKKGILFKAVP